MGETTIEWCDKTWNPIRGCSRVSEGCRNCYAERVAARFSGPDLAFEGLTRRTPAGPRWTGKVNIIEEHLADPLRWRKPARVFVNSVSDLFHGQVPDEWIDRVFATMALARRHVFQVLTKRPERMAAWFALRRRCERVADAMADIEPEALGKIGRVRYGDDWPLPNVELGVSVEDQPTAEDRIPKLLEAPAAVHFVSAEPLLGPIDFRQVPNPSPPNPRCPAGRPSAGVRWIIVGGVPVRLRSRKGGDPSEWPEDVRRRELPRLS